MKVDRQPFPTAGKLEPGAGAVGAEYALTRIADLAEQFGNQEIAEDARSSGERIAAGRFYVACVGQFKRGKSTLLNALISAPILPSGITPVTAIPTVVRYGAGYGARIRSEFGSWINVAIEDIEQFVSEEGNPHNQKGVSGVEVFVPNSFLAQGMCLVDTPGLGSVFEANTAATHAFIPHIDAAIVVIGADPPISGEELNLVESVSQHVTDLLFVLNKADRVSESERTAAISFATEMIETRLNRHIPPVWEVSALERLNNRGSAREWEGLIGALKELTQRTDKLMRDAGSRSVRRLSFQLLTVVKQDRDALVRPFAESEKRLQELRRIAFQAEQSLSDLGSLFSAEQHRLAQKLSKRRDAFLESVRKPAHQKLRSLLRTQPKAIGPKYRRAVMRFSQEIARSLVHPWLSIERDFAEQEYQGMANRFIDLANDFLERVRTMDSDLVHLPEAMRADETLQSRSKFQFYDFIDLAMPSSPLRYLLDIFLGSIRFYSPIHSHAHGFLDRLLDTNGERVGNDLEDRVRESRTKLQAEVSKMLHELSRVAERSLERARNAHAEGDKAVKSAVLGLDKLEAELLRLQQWK
jgi:Dynamin family